MQSELPLHPAAETLSVRPLLTIAIPTFNRADQLERLLQVLEPQVAKRPEVEVLVSDNASQDHTCDVVANAGTRYCAAGAQFHAYRQPVNLGSDGNFAFCFRRAAGRFFWLCGDDDLIVPGALDEVLALLKGPKGEPADLDLVYATSYSFRDGDWVQRKRDPLNRRVHTIESAHTFALIVNIMFTFISGMVVNRDRFKSLPHEEPESFIGTNLVQLSWSLPLLLHHRRSAVLWTRPVAACVGHAHGYSLGGVFGRQLSAVVHRLLPGRPDLSKPILNVALRRWFPSVIVQIRGQEHDLLGLHEAHSELRMAFGRNPRYWAFTYPALILPLNAARWYNRLTGALSRVLYMVRLPGFWRRET